APVILGVRLSNLARLVGWILACVAAALVLSSRWRRAARELACSPAGFLAGAALCAAWLSLGPTVTSLGRTFPGLGVYDYLFRYVPGFGATRDQESWSSVRCSWPRPGRRHCRSARPGTCRACAPCRRALRSVPDA